MTDVEALVDVAAVRTTPLDDTVATFRNWLHLPDAAPLLAVLGAVAANRLSGDPVWLLLVGPSGSGKSELLSSLAGLDDVYPAATLTEASLLSGTPKREHDTGAKGGLLRAIGDFGILLHKDFTSVLSMNRDARSLVLAALREIYDGSWTRHLGTGGGITLAWSGKVGLVAGCTPTIDRHHGVMGSMGERFVLFRLPTIDSSEQARRALAHSGREQAMRRELAAAVEKLFDRPLADPQVLTEEELGRLISLSTLVVKCRSAVERDGYSREIELIPGSEAPARIAVVLKGLLDGLDVLGADRADAWRVVVKAGLDSVPALRRAAMEALSDGDSASTLAIAKSIGYPKTTTKRALEDLAAHDVVVKWPDVSSKRDEHIWSLSAWAHERYGQLRTEPEMSGVPLSYYPDHTFDDISGTVQLGLAEAPTS